MTSTVCAAVVVFVNSFLHYCSERVKAYPERYCTFCFSASTPPLGGLLVSLFSGFFIDKWGRKYIFIFDSIILCIGCVLLRGPPIFLNLILGQILCGIAISCYTIVPVIYITESIAPANLFKRNSLATWNVLSVGFGTSWTFVSAAIFGDYRTVMLICIGFSIISTIAFLIFIPESPAWLQIKGRHGEAKLARNRLSFQKNISPYGSHSTLDDCLKRERWFSFFHKVRRKDVYKPLLTCIGLFFFQQFCGSQVYISYMIDVIKPNFLPINPYQLTAGLIPFILVSNFLYINILPRVGLRKLFMITTALVAISAFLLGLCLYLNQTYHWYSYYVDYLHIFAVTLNQSAATMGIATTPFTIMGEILPKDAKGYSSWAIVSMTIFFFTATMLYPFEIEYLHYATHFIYSLMGALGLLFIYFFVPETVGKTLQEISDNFL